MRSLSLRPGGSLTLPSKALSIDFSVLVTLHAAIQVTGFWFLPGQVYLLLKYPAFAGRTGVPPISPENVTIHNTMIYRYNSTIHADF